MMKRHFIYLIGIVFFMLGCKKLTLEIEETKCKKIKLKNPSYVKSTSKCGTGEQYKAVDVSFDFDGDEDCIHLIDLKANFVSSSGQSMNNVSFITGELLASDDKVTVSNNRITMHYCYKFDNGADSTTLGYIQLNWQTENDLENESNSIGIRMNFNTNSGTTDPRVYEDSYVSDEQLIQILVWDNADEDGDIISINHNGNWIRENLFITNAAQSISVSLTPGHNYINFYAVNQGDAGPNTLSAQVRANGKVLGNFELDSNTGETKSIKVNYVP